MGTEAGAWEAAAKVAMMALVAEVAPMAVANKAVGILAVLMEV